MSRNSVQTYVYNGTFENAPTFVAATSTTTRWIDGTASGSTSNSTYGWFTNPLTNGMVAYFDSTTSYSGTYSLHLSPNGNTNASAQIVQYSSFGPPVVGYTNYIPAGATVNWSYVMKTTVNSGSATTGAYMQFIARDNLGNIVTGGTNGASVQSTTNWTVYTGSFTMPVGASQVTPKIYYANTGGSANLNMDVWIDNVEIYVPRTTITSYIRSLGGPQTNSVFFNGINSRAALSTVSGLSTQTASLSIGGWFKYPGKSISGGASYPGAFSVFGGNGSSTGMQVYYYGAGGQALQIVKVDVSGTVHDGAASSSALYGAGPSRWYHWIITYNGTNFITYTNGIQAVQGAYSGAIVNSESSVNIGCSGTYSSPNSYFCGNICNFFVGPFITATQAALIYSSQIYPTGMIGIWQMNEGSGNTLYDSSGNSNNLTLTNGVWSSDVPYTSRTLASGRLIT